MVQGQKRLHQAVYPEKADHTGNEHKSLKQSNIMPGKTYLSEDNADKQKSTEAHQLV